MNLRDAKDNIAQIINITVSGRGKTVPQITEDTVLLGDELPIDSLDLAVLVVEMEQLTGKDPFKHGLINFRTVGELARLYAD